MAAMTPASSARLTRAVVEVEQYVAGGGWDQPPRLYALVETAELLAREPALAARLGPSSLPGELTPVEQEDLPRHATLEELLAGITWPAEVAGAALVVERVMLPPQAEAELAEAGGDPDRDLVEWVARHPQRQEVRLAVGVLRSGARECALRLRSHDSDDAVMSGPDLVPGLAEALAGTLAD
jgi:hypothetical protein